MQTPANAAWTNQSSRQPLVDGSPVHPSASITLERPLRGRTPTGGPTMRPTRLLHSALALLTLAAGPALAGGGHGHDHHRAPWAVDPVVGVWIAEVTQRDCSTGTPLVSFKGMSVLHHGGTLSETNATPPAGRGPAWGTWERHRNQYRASFRFMRYFPDGNLAGFTVVRREFTLSADGNSLSGVARFEIQDPAGHVIATGCATDVTTRFQ